MTLLEFTRGMKIISTCYFKDFTDDAVKIWYMSFKDIEQEPFYKAIEVICKSNKFCPVLKELYDESNRQRKNYFLKILQVSSNIIPKDKLEDLQGLIDWYSLKNDYPKEIVNEIHSYRDLYLSNQKLTQRRQLK